MADSVEAVIAAIFIDGGLEPAKKFIIENLKKFYSKCIRERHGNEKPIYCYENNMAYQSIQNASEQLNIAYNSINCCVKGKQNSAKKLHFTYLLDLIHDVEPFWLPTL